MSKRRLMAHQAGQVATNLRPQLSIGGPRTRAGSATRWRKRACPHEQQTAGPQPGIAHDPLPVYETEKVELMINSQDKPNRSVPPSLLARADEDRIDPT